MNVYRWSICFPLVAVTDVLGSKAPDCYLCPALFRHVDTAAMQPLPSTFPLFSSSSLLTLNAEQRGLW